MRRYRARHPAFLCASAFSNLIIASGEDEASWQLTICPELRSSVVERLVEGRGERIIYWGERSDLDSDLRDRASGLLTHLSFWQTIRVIASTDASCLEIPEPL